MPQVSFSVVFKIKGYFSLFLVNGGVVLFKLAYFKDNRVVSKWCNIGLKLFLVPIYIQVELYYINNFLYGITTVSKLQGVGFNKG